MAMKVMLEIAGFVEPIEKPLLIVMVVTLVGVFFSMWLLDRSSAPKKARYKRHPESGRPS
jgi:hypothetical protein